MFCGLLKGGFDAAYIHYVMQPIHPHPIKKVVNQKKKFLVLNKN